MEKDGGQSGDIHMIADIGNLGCELWEYSLGRRRVFRSNVGMACGIGIEGSLGKRKKRSKR
jgi:hypothetical protein